MGHKNHISHITIHISESAYITCFTQIYKLEICFHKLIEPTFKNRQLKENVQIWRPVNRTNSSEEHHIE